MSDVVQSMAGSRRTLPVLLALLLVPVLSCGQESPTEVGGPLIPSDAVRTFQVILDATAWLEADTAFSGFDNVYTAGYYVVAEKFENTLDAHTIGRFEVPRIIAANDSAGNVRSDSMPAIIGGRVVLQLDTLRSEAPVPFEVSAWRIDEEFDAVTADWNLRVDSGGVRLPWAQPGATGGPLLATVSWPQGRDSLNVPFDSLSIPIDSATLALWADTANHAKGVVVTMTTSGGRIRASDFVLRIDARPSFRPDTIVTVTIRPNQRTFLFNPELPAQSTQLRVGGRPSWRSYFRFRDGFESLSIPCPQVSPTCTVRLRDANITYGALMLTPDTPPAGFLPQDSMRLQSAQVLASALLPLERSPLGSGAGAGRDFLLPARFAPPSGGEATEITVTEFVRTLAADTTTTGDRPTRWLGLLPLVEGADFGMAAFLSSPRLRLVLTVARELQLR